MLFGSVHAPTRRTAHAPSAWRVHAPATPDGYTYRVDEERYGPLSLERVLKEDGRALILFARA